MSGQWPDFEAARGLPRSKPPSAPAVSTDGSCSVWFQQFAHDDLRRVLLFVGLNPSRADAGRDDPTLRRLQGFARAHHQLVVLNLFARISLAPVVLRRSADPVGEDNDRVLRRWFLGWASTRLGSLARLGCRRWSAPTRSACGADVATVAAAPSYRNGPAGHRHHPIRNRVILSMFRWKLTHTLDLYGSR